MTRYPRSLLLIVSLCFFLSGFAALLYQTAWLREFSIAFGTSELAVAMILAVYMGGLAIGAAVAEPLVGKITRPVLVYGLLEAGIAGAALCVPMAADWAGSLYAALLGGQSMPPDARGLGQSMFYLLAGFVILIVPTALMGATLPVLMRSVVRTDAEIGPRAALLYGINTAGAVAGAVIAGFLLLGSLGLKGTVWVGVAVNVLIFFIAAAAVKIFPTFLAAPEQPTSNIVPAFFADCLRPLVSRARPWQSSLSNQPAWILPVMLVSGANTFIYEVLWTRLLSHIVGSSIYAFATMLAAFLTGIALGGAAAGRLTRDRTQAAHTFVDAQIAIAAISLGVFVFMDQLLPPTRGLAVNVVLAASVLLPPALCIGLTFPLAVRILSPDAQLAAKCTARVYAWNTFGAIIGAILAGFFLIPGLGFEGAIRFAVLVNLALALVVATLVANRSFALKLGLLLVIGGISAFVHLQRPDAIMRGSSLIGKSDAYGTDLYFGVGRSSTVRLTELPQSYQLRNNGLPEAMIFPKGSPPFFIGWRWLTSLPLAARPTAESMLVVGLGGGVAIELLPSGLREAHVVELEEEVINANELVGPLRNSDPLGDARVTVVVNDARNALRLTGRKYDIIVSQPSQPWTPGASHLYTTEFAHLAKSRLNPGGVFLQWMSSNFMDADLLKTLTATLTDVFPYVRLYSPDSTNLMFVASDAPLLVETTLAEAFAVPGLAAHLRKVGIAGSEELMAAMLLDDTAARKFAAGAPLSNDNHNLMATKSRYLQDGITTEELVDVIAGIDPLADRRFWVRTQASGIPVDFLRLATRLAKRPEMRSRLAGLAGAVDNPVQSQIIHSVYLLSDGQSSRALRQLQELLQSNPDQQQARYLLVFAQLGDVLAGTTSAALEAEIASLDGVPAALLQALHYERSGDWTSIAQLDGVLATSKSTDIWFSDVARIRATWRLRPGIDDAESRAGEALRLIDEQFPLRSDMPVSLLSLRANAGAQIGDAPTVLESASFVAAQFQQSMEMAESMGGLLNYQQRLAQGAAVNSVADLLHRHPEWRNQPRGPAVYDFVSGVRNEYLVQ